MIEHSIQIGENFFDNRVVLQPTEESYDFVMGINTKGTLFLTQAVQVTMQLTNYMTLA